MSRRGGGGRAKRALAFVVSTVATYSVLHYMGGADEEDYFSQESSSSSTTTTRSTDDAYSYGEELLRDHVDINDDSNVFVSSPSPPPPSPPPPPPPPPFPPPPVPPTKVPTSLGDEKTTPEEGEEEKKWSHPTSMRRKPTAEEIEQGRGKFHVMLTANEQSYVAWQSRIMYQRYLKLLRSGDSGAFGGFTRVLHSERPDDLMDEIPSVVVDPLPKGVDQGYVVLNRPYAIKQWLEKYNFAEEYVFMTEPDHLYLRPIPLLAQPKLAAAFPFFYINPKDPKFTPIVQKFNKVNADLEDFAPIGNSPVMIHKDELSKVCTVWDTLAIKMKHDAETNAAFGWVLEMWAYSIASAQVGVKYNLVPEFMLQPPWDKTEEIRGTGKKGYILHYTYGQDFNEKGQFTPGKVGKWHWDKRDFTWKKPPREGFEMPPEGTHPLTIKLMEMINEGIRSIPNW